MRKNEALYTSNSDDWGTPQDLFDELNAIYNFDLDVAASAQNAKCERYFTKEIDGLSQKWESKTCIWCNPPYGKPLPDWCKKCVEEYERGNNIVMLLPARTSTRWFHQYLYKHFKIEFLPKRLKFIHEGISDSAPFGSMLVFMVHNINGGENK